MTVALDLTGQRFGEWIVQDRGPNNQRGQSRWNCRCACGTKRLVNSSCLKNGKSRSCGCLAAKEKGEQLLLSAELLVGSTFGRLTIERVSLDGMRVVADCRCSCGGKKSTGLAKLKAGRPTSCGCLRRERLYESQFIDLKGQVFGRLTAVSSHVRKNATYWECQCDCGGTAVVHHSHLKLGATQSCGCIKSGDDSVSMWLDGRFRKAEEDSFFYVFRMKNFDHLSKPGITCDISQRLSNSGGNQYGDLYDFISLKRIDAWLVEQALLRATASSHECPEALKAWDGRSELRNLKVEQLFELACDLHSLLQEHGRHEFALRFLSLTSDQVSRISALLVSTDA